MTGENKAVLHIRLSNSGSVSFNRSALHGLGSTTRVEERGCEFGLSARFNPTFTLA